MKLGPGQRQQERRATGLPQEAPGRLSCQGRERGQPGCLKLGSQPSRVEGIEAPGEEVGGPQEPAGDGPDPAWHTGQRW